MMMTPDQMKNHEADYASAYAQDAPQKVEPTEDEAFGITPDAAEGTPAEEAAEAPAQEAAEGPEDAAAGGEPAGQTAMEAAGDTAAAAADEAPRGEGEGGVPMDLASPGEAAVEADEAVEVQPQTTGANGAPKPAMTEQQLKSWEGRLRKAQAELDAKPPAMEPAAIEALETVGEQAEATNPALAEAAETAADKVEDGVLTAAQAMKQLAEDFGEDFVKMIEVIATAKAKEAGASAASDRVGELGGTVQEIIAHIQDSSAKAHFEQIAAKHPDFADIGQSEGFRSYIDAMPDADKAEATRVAGTGSSKEINKLLDGYKATQTADAPEQEAPAKDPVVDAAMDAAEGVRSSGMALPEKPAAASDGYEAAWDEFK